MPFKKRNCNEDGIRPLMKKIAIITARGGSKRIPKKNIKDFCGKPLIAYSIEAAIKSGIFDRVLVSTDSEEIKEIAIRYGAEVPFLRSEKNSNDFASTADVILEVLDELKLQRETYEYLCCLYPTAPMITALKLQKSFELLVNQKANSVIPVTKFSYPVQRALVLVEGKLQLREHKFKDTRSQDLEQTFHDSGQFYWVKTEAFIKEKNLVTTNCHPMILPEMEVQDIDSDEDFLLAELKYKLMTKQS